MNLNTKGIFISMFQLAEKGELSKLEQKHVLEALMSYGNFLIRNKPFEEIDKEFKKIREGSRILLEQTENCIDSALEMLKAQMEYINDFKDELQNLPEFAMVGDDIETLEFIKSLNQDVYNFSEASRLTNITRQTIKNHADKKKHGLKTIIIGKSEYITKEALVSYYRLYFDKNPDYNFY